jgi:signal peptidase I
MSPTLRPGDRLLVDPSAYRRRPPAVADVVVLVDPGHRDRWLVKRIASIDLPGRTVEVRGDAIERARDSRHFGPVPFGAIVGRAYRLYFPPARRREL